MRKLFPECIAGNFNGPFKMTHFKFIMVAHIHNQGIRICSKPVKSFRINILTFIFHTEFRVTDSVGYNFLADFDF